MTLRNRTRNRRPSRLSKQSRPKRPRSSALAQPTVSRVSDGAPAGVPSRLGERKESRPSPPAAPPATPRNEPPRNGSQAGNASNGSAGISPGGSAASALRFDRKTAQTLTVKEAAYRLNKNTDTVYQWLRLGRLRGWQLGGRRCAVLVCEESVEETLACGMGVNGGIHSA